jgi:hypothetical protein
MSLLRDGKPNTWRTTMVPRRTVLAMPRRRQLELQHEGKSFNRDISLVIPAKNFGSLDVDSFDPVTTETVVTPSLHAKGEIPKERELVVIKDSSTEGWFLSEVLRVLPNLVEVRYFTTPTPALEDYEHCSVKGDRNGSVRSASAARGMSVSASMSVERPISHPIRTTKTCKSGKEC